MSRESSAVTESVDLQTPTRADTHSKVSVHGSGCARARMQSIYIYKYIHIYLYLYLYIYSFCMPTQA